MPEIIAKVCFFDNGLLVLELLSQLEIFGVTKLCCRFSLPVPEEHRAAGGDGRGPQPSDGHADQRLGRHEGKLRAGRQRSCPARLGGPGTSHQVLLPGQMESQGDLQ